MTSPGIRTSVPVMQSSKQDPATPAGTATQKLASHLLGGDVRDFIRVRRDAGRAWRFVARDLYDATAGQVDVTYETLRQWHEDVAA